MGGGDSTVLHYATVNGSLECVRLLCKQHSHILNMKDIAGWTALHSAVYNNLILQEITKFYNLKVPRLVNALNVGNKHNQVVIATEQVCNRKRKRGDDDNDNPSEEPSEKKKYNILW